MSRHTPTIFSHSLTDPVTPDSRIRLDSPAWFAWLEAPTTTRFAYPLFDPAVGYSVGFMTVRTEHRQRGGAYWTAYRRAGHQLRKIYLGRASAGTQTRLQAVAATLRHVPATTTEPDQPP